MNPGQDAFIYYQKSTKNEKSGHNLSKSPQEDLLCQIAGANVVILLNTSICSLIHFLPNTSAILNIPMILYLK